MHEVEFNGQAKKVAATWDELSRQQLELLLPVLYGQYSDAHQQRIEVLEVLLGVSRPQLLRLTPVQLLQVCWLTDFLLAAPIALTRQLLPHVKPARLLPAYYGPAAELANVSFLEFAFADAYFVAYANSQQAPWLDQLVATLYCPGRPRAWPPTTGAGPSTSTSSRCRLAAWPGCPGSRAWPSSPGTAAAGAR